MKTRTQFLAALATFLVFAVQAATTHYVDLNSQNATAPFTSWPTAATNIQDAVDAASPGDTVLVTNGVYATGGRAWFDSGTNRVTLTNAVTLQSVNGPQFTLIVGNRVAGTGLALTNTARCVGMGSSAVLSGFTLTNGEGGWANYPNGGGVAKVVGLPGSSIVTNCVLIGNLATNSVGGGAYRVTLIDCVISGNSANQGGGACACTLTRCTVVSNSASSGGGVYGSTTFGASILTNCTLVGNSASIGGGGGAYGSTLVNCSLTGNFGGQAGGGAYGGALYSCLISNNAAGNGGGAYVSVLCNSLIVGNSAYSGGGLLGVIITNCTVVSNFATNSGGGINGGSGSWSYNSICYNNTAPDGSNSIGAKFINSCTAPNVFGGGITNEPLFINLAGGDFHLQSNSPCINSGANALATGTSDLDGNPRIAGGTVDMGAYEFQSPASLLSYAWAQQYGLATDGSEDFADADGDHMNNWQEWLAGTVPTNAASALIMNKPAVNASGLQLTWQSTNSKHYFVQRATDLSASPAFSTIRSDLTGGATSTTYLDTTATNGGPYYYRVGVQP